MAPLGFIVTALLVCYEPELKNYNIELWYESEQMASNMAKTLSTGSEWFSPKRGVKCTYKNVSYHNEVAK